MPAFPQSYRTTAYIALTVALLVLWMAFGLLAVIGIAALADLALQRIAAQRELAVTDESTGRGDA